MNENLEVIGQAIDELESLIGALNIPMGAEFHIEQIKILLPEKVKKIKDALIAESGENPWD